MLATVSAGLLMGNLGVLADEADRFALTSQGRAFVVEFWEFAAFVANSLVFLLIGLALAATPTRTFGALAVVVALALAGRAAAVYPDLVRSSRVRAGRFPGPSSIFSGGAGLRGALALALALALPPATPYRDEILVAAFGVVAFSVLVQGLTAKLALRALRLDRRRAKRARPRPAMHDSPRASAGDLAARLLQHLGDLARAQPRDVGQVRADAAGANSRGTCAVTSSPAGAINSSSITRVLPATVSSAISG